MILPETISSDGGRPLTVIEINSDTGAISINDIAIGSIREAPIGPLVMFQIRWSMMIGGGIRIFTVEGNAHNYIVAHLMKFFAP